MADDLLYHYTSSQAFISIVDRKCLWLSGRWNQNDSNEGLVFRGFLKDFADQNHISTTKVAEILNTLTTLESYICCFSSNGDLLSQWRGYADNATGVSIGFRRNHLITVVNGDPKALLRPVTYADSLDELKEETKDLMMSLLHSTGTPSDNFVLSAAKVVWELKNRAFSEESETRLIFTAAPGAPPGLKESLTSGVTVARKHRAVDAGVREYCEVNIDSLLPDGIAEVILGPRTDSHVEVVTRVLGAAGWNCTVRRSVATYR